MKKRSTILAAICAAMMLTAGSFALTGCGDDAQEETNNNTYTVLGTESSADTSSASSALSIPSISQNKEPSGMFGLEDTSDQIEATAIAGTWRISSFLSNTDNSMSVEQYSIATSTDEEKIRLTIILDAYGGGYCIRTFIDEDGDRTAVSSDLSYTISGNTITYVLSSADGMGNVVTSAPAELVYTDEHMLAMKQVNGYTMLLAKENGSAHTDTDDDENPYGDSDSDNTSSEEDQETGYSSTNNTYDSTNNTSSSTGSTYDSTNYTYGSTSSTTENDKKSDNSDNTNNSSKTTSNSNGTGLFTVRN